MGLGGRRNVCINTEAHMTTNDDSKDDAAAKPPTTARRREVLRTGDLTNTDIAAIASGQMDPKYRCFDKELEPENSVTPNARVLRRPSV